MATTTYTDATFLARALGARTNSAGTPVTDITAEEDRLSHEFSSEGWLMEADSFVPTFGAALTMNVFIGSNQARKDFYVVDGDATDQGKYVVRLAARVQVAVDAAHATLPRKDEIYLVVEDHAYDGNSRSLARLGYRKGTASITPMAPGEDAGWNAAVLLATVDIPAGAPDITSATITDERIEAQLLIDAATLDGLSDTDFAATAHNHTGDYAVIAHEGDTVGHPEATVSASGFEDSADKNKLDGIESGANVNPSAATILTQIKAVDGAGSLLDADLLDGIQKSGLALTSHNHNALHYTESEQDSLMNAKRNKPEGVFLRYSSTSGGYIAGSKIIIGQNVEDRDDWNGHGAGSSTMQIAAESTADYYLVIGQIIFESNSTGLRQASLYSITQGDIAIARAMPATGGESTILQVKTIWKASSASDEIQLHLYHTADESLSILADCFLKVIALDH